MPDWRRICKEGVRPSWRLCKIAGVTVFMAFRLIQKRKQSRCKCAASARQRKSDEKNRKALRREMLHGSLESALYLRSVGFHTILRSSSRKRVPLQGKRNEEKVKKRLKSGSLWDPGRTLIRQTYSFGIARKGWRHEFVFMDAGSKEVDSQAAARTA